MCRVLLSATFPRIYIYMYCYCYYNKKIKKIKHTYFKLKYALYIFMTYRIREYRYRQNTCRWRHHQGLGGAFGSGDRDNLSKGKESHTAHNILAAGLLIIFGFFFTISERVFSRIIATILTQVSKRRTVRLSTLTSEILKFKFQLFNCVCGASVIGRVF